MRSPSSHCQGFLCHNLSLCSTTGMAHLAHSTPSPPPQAYQRVTTALHTHHCSAMQKCDVVKACVGSVVSLCRLSFWPQAPRIIIQQCLCRCQACSEFATRQCGGCWKQWAERWALFSDPFPPHFHKKKERSFTPPPLLTRHHNQTSLCHIRGSSISEYCSPTSFCHCKNKPQCTVSMATTNHDALLT